MKQLVCLSHLPWAAVPTRTQQLVSRFREVDILFFEPWGHSRRGGRRVRPNVVVYPLPARLSESMKLLAVRSGAQVTGVLKKVLKKHCFREPTFWLTSPEQYAWVEELPRRGLVYDCDREWDLFPLEWESELAFHADVAFAASPGLARRLSPCCDNIALIPNGVNFPMFARDDWELPAPLRGRRKPVLCRVGDVTAELELEPLFSAAEGRLGWTFVLVGEVEETVRPQLEKFPNIVLPGRLPLVDVPDYVGSSQVCFDLLSTPTRGSDVLPGRIYEYLATGNPVVLMLAPGQTAPFPNVVYCATTPAGFVRRCEEALEEDPLWVRGRRRIYAEEAAWRLRAEEARRILEDGGLL